MIGNFKVYQIYLGTYSIISNFYFNILLYHYIILSGNQFNEISRLFYFVEI
jgi:hypothetical protein